MVGPTGKSWNHFLDILAERNAALGESSACSVPAQSATPRFSDRPLFGGFNEGSRPRPLIAEAVADIALVRGAATQFTLTLQHALAAASASPRASMSNTNLIRRLVLSSRCVTNQTGNCSEGRLGSTFSMPGSASPRTSGCIEMP